MNSSDIENIIKSLAEERLFFWSEADFQFALAWKIQEKYSEAMIRLERGVVLEPPKKNYVDIWVELDNRIYPIELKYKTRKYEAIDKTGERILTTSQSAWDVGRHSYLKDIERIEKYSDLECFERGFAIMLTNDQHYYNPEKAPKETTDRDFVIHDGARIQGGKEMFWHSDKSWATNLGKITLRNTYIMSWKPYSVATDKKGDFKYVITEIE